MPQFLLRNPALDTLTACQTEDNEIAEIAGARPRKARFYDEAFSYRSAGQPYSQLTVTGGETLLLWINVIDLSFDIVANSLLLPN